MSSWAAYPHSLGCPMQGLDFLTSRVEMLSKGAETSAELPPLSCGTIYGAAAIAVDETHSTSGQVLLLGGRN